MKGEVLRLNSSEEGCERIGHKRGRKTDSARGDEDRLWRRLVTGQRPQTDWGTRGESS